LRRRWVRKQEHIKGEDCHSKPAQLANWKGNQKKQGKSKCKVYLANCVIIFGLKDQPYSAEAGNQHDYTDAKGGKERTGPSR